MPVNPSETPLAPEVKSIRSPRVLVVVSMDFGEMGLAWQFIQATKFAETTLILLPGHLYDSNKDSLPCQGARFSRFEQVKELAKTFKPEVVLLCSGYLLVPNGIASNKELALWMQELKQGKCQILTTDPFLGFTSEIRPQDISTELVWQREMKGQISKTLAKMAIPLLRYWVCRRFHKTARTLSLANRLSAVPAPRKHFASSPLYCFRPSRESGRESTMTFEDDPYWAFVLSDLDYSWQCRRYGTPSVSQNLIKWIENSLHQGRRVRVLAPESCIEAIKPMLPKAVHGDLFYKVPYRQFKDLVNGAEHTFYWNMVSFSLLLRIGLRQPVHFLSRGHTFHMFPELHRRAIQQYYYGMEPYVFPPDALPSVDTLKESAREFYKAMSGLTGAIAAAPTPDEVLQQLFRENSNTQVLKG